MTPRKNIEIGTNVLNENYKIMFPFLLSIGFIRRRALPPLKISRACADPVSMRETTCKYLL